MIRVHQTVAVWLFAASAVLCAQNAKTTESGGEGLFTPPKGGAPNGAGGPPRITNKGLPKAPPVRIGNPTSPAAHLYKLTADQRDRALEKLPFQMQQRLRKELAQFDALPKEQQQMIIGQTERYDALSPEKQLAFRQQLQALAQLEKERRQQVTAALRRLHNAVPSERARILARPAFRERFSPEEFQMIGTLGEVLLPPN
jgi:hypothetical protein